MSTLPKPSIAILGAGPAGSVAALALAKAGVEVTVIDKATFPRHKPCGDVITSQTLRTLERVGLDPTHDMPLQQGQATWGTTFIAPNGKAVDIAFKPLHKGTEVPSCYTLSRYAFDEWLVGQLTAKGISLLVGTAVKSVSRTPDQRWQLSLAGDAGNSVSTYDYLIVATGCNSSLVHQVTEAAGTPWQPKAKDDRHFGVGLRAYFHDQGGWRQQCMPEFYLFKRLMPGGMYLTPLANGLVNVNMVMRKDYVRKHGINLQERFWQTLAEEPTLKGRFSKAHLASPLQGSSLSFGTTQRPISGPGYLLAGDAAGLIDLLSANGICNAVQSAELAAETIVSYLESGQELRNEVLHEYDAIVEQKLGKELKLGRLVAPFLGQEWTFPVVQAGLNFVASRVDGGGVLSQLLYHPDVNKLLKSPDFYKQLLFGKTASLGTA